MEAQKEHYLDNSATTQVLPSVAQKAVELMVEEFGNPSSLHTRGFRARKLLEEARSQVAQALGAQPEEITFTSGGTESNNLVLFGAAQARRRLGNKIVTTAVEHDSVLNPCRALEQQGFEVVYLKPDKDGRLPEEALMEAIDDKTILVSVMLVNNETGAIFPVEAAAKAIRRKKAPALLHTDAVQGFGKLPFTVKKLGVDQLTLSGHKIHAPKGIGVLYMKKGTRILPRTLGGGQERGLRSGTESVPLICALGEAVKQLPPAQEALGRVGELNTLLRRELAQLPQVTVHSPEEGLPYVLNFSAGRVRGETMLHFLAERGVYVSSGSACGKAKPSHVLEAMGLPKEQVESALRVSFSRFSTQEDVEALVEGLKLGLETLAQRG
ncbi:cysteine sulfinate desulfinase/cysteine desulfurase and related enzymes [Clostridium sp. CAG:1013]|nr:cysteine sulfinate desulfinase/cysteine desulfurase and related enzymes [Clostridium sp. CAG:1013]